ncbi:MAG: tRNA 2-thiouridine(34) synthase MnmA [Coriobacteriia bacterium]|nr:tRNA 2-thiouridine(34) synthase MnmA [Coriobacteriia bacterium]
MSGGVDSSVAALLMQEQGYACVAVTMRLHDEGDSAAESARAVANKLGIPFHVLDLTKDFADEVIEAFVASYESGETPNPCINCNRALKFGRLLAYADKLNCDVLATGHYARTRYVAASERWQLLRASDAVKDQSYVLYGLTQAQLARVRFPLGDRAKSETRARAAEAGFANADAPDSQDICFVPDGDYGAFIARWRGAPPAPGDILDDRGQVIGQHKGMERYTIGQRKGLELAVGRPVYVTAKDPVRNTVTLGDEARLYHQGLLARAVNWVSIPPTIEPLRAQVKTSYRSPAVPATIQQREGGLLQVTFDAPIRAATPGQAVVAYDGDLVLAGATITSVF